MANISTYLAAILAATYGEEVRGSIHDAIEIINDASEVVLSTGTAVDSASSSSTGFFEDSLYLNTNTYELWKCVGTDSWQSLGILKGNDGDPGTPGADGEDGNLWYIGTGIAGKYVNPTVYSGSGITDAHINDCYLNNNEGAVYHCTLGGDASTATWVYDFTMTGGGGGSSYTAGTGISISNANVISIDPGTITSGNAKPVTGDAVNTALAGKSDSGHTHTTTIAADAGASSLDMAANTTYKITAGGTNFIFKTPPGGSGHDMPSNANILTAIGSADNTNDKVSSLYGIKEWSNCDAIQILTAVSVDDDGVGTWEDDATWETGSRTGWITHSALYGILSDDDVEIEPVFKITGGDAVGLYAMRIDDAVTGSTGGVALKFTAPITASGYVGIKLKHLRTNTEIV